MLCRSLCFPTFYQLACLLFSFLFTIVLNIVSIVNEKCLGDASFAMQYATHTKKVTKKTKMLGWWVLHDHCYFCSVFFFFYPKTYQHKTCQRFEQYARKFCIYIYTKLTSILNNMLVTFWKKKWTKVTMIMWTPLSKYFYCFAHYFPYASHTVLQKMRPPIASHCKYVTSSSICS